MRAVIMAGGNGTRMGELCKDRPKCLLPVNNKDTILDGIIEALLIDGFDVELCLGYLHD